MGAELCNLQPQMSQIAHHQKDTDPVCDVQPRSPIEVIILAVLQSRSSVYVCKQTHHTLNGK